MFHSINCHAKDRDRPAGFEVPVRNRNRDGYHSSGQFQPQVWGGDEVLPLRQGEGDRIIDLIDGHARRVGTGKVPQHIFYNTGEVLLAPT
jgi:hypothetical protein